MPLVVLSLMGCVRLDIEHHSWKCSGSIHAPADALGALLWLFHLLGAEEHG